MASKVRKQQKLIATAASRASKRPPVPHRFRIQPPQVAALAGVMAVAAAAVGVGMAVAVDVNFLLL